MLSNRPMNGDQRIATIMATNVVIRPILWSPFIGRFESMYQGIIALICYIAPPITAVFLWGVLWRRASATAAQVTLYVGSALGLTVFLLDWFKERTGWDLPTLMAAFYLFVICSVILAIGSMICPHRHTAESRALVWAHPFDALRGEAWRGIGNYKMLSAVLLATMVALYVVFG